MPEPLQILVVDDDDHMVRTLSDILRFKGYEPQTATTGGSGLEMTKSLTHPVAVALVDLRLPDMDGIELIGRLHELSSETEVIVLTGNASLDTAVRALRENSFDYLTKPVEPTRLLDTVGRAGERWRRKVAETALNKSELRLRNMFQAIGDSVFITNRTGRIVDANRAALELSGYSLADLQSLAFSELIRGPDGGRSVGAAASELARPGLGEFTLRSRGGAFVVVEVITAAFTSDLFVHTARDQTDRRRLEEQLSQAQRLEAVGQLAGGIAHDFNNILTAIKGYASLMEPEVETDSFHAEGLREIIGAADRASRLTRELLTFSRRQIFVPTILDPNDVILGIEGMLRRLIREDVHLETLLGSDTGSLKADKGQMEQVLVNLAVNAGDAMPDGGTLTIATTRTRVEVAPVGGSEGERARQGEAVPAGDYVLLTVTDSGAGMSEETVARIFEPFFTTKEVGKGTGLGLSTVYGIVKRSDGFIQVESTPGVGTTFSLLFPRWEERPGPAEDALLETPSAHHSGTETVLVAEDDPTVRSFIRKAFASHGYQILAAGNPDEVIEAARGHNGTIHLLLADLVMPGMGGRELATLVRECHPETRIVLTSGYAPSSTDRQALQGFDGFLEKPFTIVDLLTETRRVLRKERGTPRRGF